MAILKLIIFGYYNWCYRLMSKLSRLQGDLLWMVAAFVGIQIMINQTTKAGFIISFCLTHYFCVQLMLACHNFWKDKKH